MLFCEGFDKVEDGVIFLISPEFVKKIDMSNCLMVFWFIKTLIMHDFVSLHDSGVVSVLESVPLAVLVMVHLGEPTPAKSEPETTTIFQIQS